MRAGETQENAFNRTLVPEFVGGIAVGVLSGETDKNEILRSKDLLSIQSYAFTLLLVPMLIVRYVELAARLFNGEVKQSLPLGNGTVRFSRYGFGGEKVRFRLFSLLPVSRRLTDSLSSRVSRDRIRRLMLLTLTNFV